MSEAFFETPGLLRGEYPALRQLSRYYRQDPAPRRRPNGSIPETFLCLSPDRCLK
jgi:Mlc titration factor MtfA (ptsG expression regulator)